MIFGWFRNRRARKLEEKRKAQEYMINALHRQRFADSHAQIAQSFRQGNPASVSQNRQSSYGQGSDDASLALMLAAIESPNRVEVSEVPDSAPSFSGYGGGDSGGGGASSDWGSSSSSSSDSSCSSSSDSSSSSSCDSGGGGGSDF